MKKILKYLGIIIVTGLILITIINIYVLSFSKTAIIYDIDKLETTTVGLVFGARVLPDGTPSDILKDRLKVSIEAYKNGKISKILVSGDNGMDVYDEPTSMRNYLIKNGVNIDDIYLDYAGFDTYDSLYRAKLIFGINDIVLFTQEYHLKRAIYISKKLGMNTIGMSTDLQKYIYADYYDRREILSRVKAFLDIDILNSKPKFLGNKVNMNKVQVEISITETEKKIVIQKINWDKDLIFSYCNYSLDTIRDDKNINIIEEKIKTFKEDSKYGKYGRFPLFINEYCKTSDSKKYIFSAHDKIPIQIGKYDIDLDLFESAKLKSFVFDELGYWAHTGRRNYGDISLERYYIDYRKSKQNQNGFGKKKGNIIEFNNYGISLIGNAEVGQMYAGIFLNKGNLDYCNEGLTPAGKLSVCFADVFYKYDLEKNILYEDKICSYFIDDSGKINTLQKCFQNSWE